MDMLDLLVVVGWIWAVWTGARQGVLASVIKVIGVSVAYYGAIKWHGAIEGMLPDFVSPPSLPSLDFGMLDGSDDQQTLIRANMFFGALSFLLVFTFFMFWVHVAKRALTEIFWHIMKPSTWVRKFVGSGIALIGALMSTCILLNAIQLFPGDGFAYEIAKAPVSQWILSETIVVRDHLLQVGRLRSSPL